MKKLILISAILLLPSLLAIVAGNSSFSERAGGACFAQVPPEGINYQAVARDNSGTAISNAYLKVRFTIRELTAFGTVVFREIHEDTTNLYGLFTLVIGKGTLVSTDSFSAINWENGSKYLEVEIDTLGGTSFISMGTTQMMSVPYALYAKKSGTQATTGSTGLTGSTGSTGATGSIGATGWSGSTGTAGTTGSTGATGADGALNAWSLTGNVGTNGGINFIGSSDNVSLRFRTNNTEKMIIDSLGKVGIGTASPNTRVDISGDVATRESNITVSGNSNNIAIGNSTFIRITGPTANFDVTGFAGGVDGKILIVANYTNYSMILRYLDSASLPINQLILNGSVDITINKNGGAIFIYSAAIGKWFLVGNSKP